MVERGRERNAQRIRAVGQNPNAADSLGVNVALVRYLTVTFGGVMAGIAGASLSIALTNIFQQNMTNGIGFVAVSTAHRWVVSLGREVPTRGP